MTSEPFPAGCADVRRRLAEGDTGPGVAAHLAGCQGCSAFAATLAELDVRLARLPVPEPPAGAADRAVARFRAESAGHRTPGEVPIAPSAASAPLLPDAPPLAGVPPPPSGRASQARRRGWRLPVSLAAAVAAVIALVVALVTVPGPPRTPLTYAAILRSSAGHTGTEKSARFDLAGTVGFFLRGQKITTALSGTGATEFPGRGELTEVTKLFGRQQRQDIVRVGDQVWTRRNGGQWVLSRTPPDRASPLHAALANPAQALDDLTRVGSGYRSLGPATVGGTRVRQIQLTIPGGSFQAFGDLPQRVRDWTVVVDVNPASLILRRLTIHGHGEVGVSGIQVPFSYSLQLTLRDFGARVSIRPPASRP